MIYGILYDLRRILDRLHIIESLLPSTTVHHIPDAVPDTVQYTVRDTVNPIHFTNPISGNIPNNPTLLVEAEAM